MFSKDGKKLVFSSNRNQSKPRETNVFIADWVDDRPTENVNETQLKKSSYLSC
jgi:Tol biopolymer transport system component